MANSKELSFGVGEVPGPYEITLHNTEGGSDKIYKVSVEDAGGLFVVNYANGRRGSTLATGAKSNQPVGWADARKIANKVIAEKVGKGYNPIAGSTFDGAAPSGIAVNLRPTDTGVRVQLCNPIEDGELEALLQNDDYVAQPKHAGERRGATVADGAATFINRKGLSVALPASIEAAITVLPGQHVTDGEQIGDVLHIFDLLEHDGVDFRALPYGRRLTALCRLFANGSVPSLDGHAIQLVETAWGEREKRALLERLIDENAEGIVFKRIDAPYKAGRPNTGGTWLKHKFCETLSAIVAGANAQRSVALELVEADGRRIPVGNVTVPANQAVAATGEVVEVRYL